MTKHKSIFNKLIIQLLFLISYQNLRAECLLLKAPKIEIAVSGCDSKCLSCLLQRVAPAFQNIIIINDRTSKREENDTLKDTLANIKKQLETIYNDDQKYRVELEKLNNQKISGSAFQDSIWRLIKTQDTINLGKVEEIIKKFGWLGPQQVGEKGSSALFFVLQHADLEVQEKYLSVLQKAVAEKNASMSNLAYFIDRIEMRTGKPQTYGTQTTALDNERFLYPVEDIANVNIRRKTAGLSSIEESFKGQKVKYNLSRLSATEEKKRDYLLNLLNSISNKNKKNIDQYITILKKYGKNSSEEIEQKKIRQNINSTLLSSIDTILSTYGWPGYSTVGMPGSSTIFSILSQADTKSIEKYLPLLRSTVLQGEASYGQLTFLEDKIEVAYGRPQIYGTQINSDKRIYPIKDEKNVNDRRIKLGLIPLQDYLKHTYGIDYEPPTKD